MDLPKLQLRQQLNGYGVQLGNDVITTEVEHGMPRQRLQSVGVVHRVSPTYRCTKAQYQYLMTFLRAYRAQAVMMYHQFDEIEPSWYECRIVSDVSVQHVGYAVYDVSFDVVAKSTRYDIGIDLALLTIYEMSQAEQDDYFNHLEKLVNQDLPNATRGLNGN